MFEQKTYLGRTEKLLRNTATAFAAFGGNVHAAAMAFFGLLSAGPMFVIALFAAERLVGRAKAHGQLTQQLVYYLGKDRAETVLRVITGLHEGTAGSIATILSALILLFAATRLFMHMQNSLHLIWGIRYSTENSVRLWVLYQLKKRLASVLLTFVALGMLVLLLTAETFATALLSTFESRIDAVWAWRILQTFIALALLVLLFAVIYRLVPEAQVRWSHAFIGATTTALLFVLGSAATGLYLGYVAAYSVYGALSAIVILPLWAYYAAQAFCLGAIFTHQWLLAEEPEDD